MDKILLEFTYRSITMLYPDVIFLDKPTTDIHLARITVV